MPAFEIFNMKEATTPTYQVTLLDEAGVPILDADLDTLVLTLYDRETGAIINSRDGQNAKDANQVAVVNGVVTWSMLVLDTPILNDALGHEIHMALWEWTYSPASDTLAGKHEARLRVENLEKVP
jgi:hypothetical protein